MKDLDHLGGLDCKSKVQSEVSRTDVAGEDTANAFSRKPPFAIEASERPGITRVILLEVFSAKIMIIDFSLRHFQSKTYIWTQDL
jgi:hypothetical protein